MTIRPVLRPFALALFALLAVGACSASPAPAAPGHDEADVAFVQMMIPHHRQAVQMSDLAPGRASSPEVLRLATDVRNAQAPEIAQMTGFLTRWGVPESGGMDAAMPGMQGADGIARLQAATGPEFGRLWVDDMTAHHRGAIQMADEVLAAGTSAEVRQLALAIKDAQSREIAEMDALRTTLG